MPELDLTKAIQAGAKALHDNDPRSYNETFETCCAREWELRDATAAITAALPHIREQLAQEFLDHLPESGLHINMSPYRDGRIGGLKSAAQIVEGPARD